MSGGWRRTVAAVFEGVGAGLRVREVEVAAPLPRLLAAVRAGALDPSRLISARYPFEDAARAYADVAAGAVVGRALIEL